MQADYFYIYTKNNFQRICQTLIQLLNQLQFMESQRYVLIGCGISALQAALILAENHKDFVILQASHRFGGKICSLTLGDALKECPDNNYQWIQKAKSSSIEFGATWLSEDHTVMSNFVKKFGLNLTDQYFEGSYIYAQNAQKYHISAQVGDYYNKYKAQINKLLQQLQKLRLPFQKLIHLKQTKNISEIQLAQLNEFYEKYDNMSAFDFILAETKDQQLTKIIDKQLSTLQCAKASQYSALDLIIDEQDPFANVKLFIGCEQASNVYGFRLKEGMLRICEGLKAQIEKVFDQQGQGKNIDDLIKFNSPVTQIKNNNVPVEVITQNKLAYKCEKAIVCVPGATFSHIKFEHLSQSKKIYIQNQLNCNMTRMALIFPQPFWRQKYSGYVSFSHNFPINELIQLTPQGKQYGVIAGIFTADSYERWNQSVVAECKSKEGQEFKKEWYEVNKRKALKIIADLFLDGNTNSPHLKQCAIITKSMSQSPFIKSTYGSIPAKSTACKINRLGKDSQKPYDDEKNVIVLGSDFSPQFLGYMEGGVRIARRKIYALCKKEDPLANLYQES